MIGQWRPRLARFKFPLLDAHWRSPMLPHNLPPDIEFLQNEHGLHHSNQNVNTNCNFLICISDDTVKSLQVSECFRSPRWLFSAVRQRAISPSGAPIVDGEIGLWIIWAHLSELLVSLRQLSCLQHASRVPGLPALAARFPQESTKNLGQTYCYKESCFSPSQTRPGRNLAYLSICLLEPAGKWVFRSIRSWIFTKGRTDTKELAEDENGSCLQYTVLDCKVSWWYGEQPNDVNTLNLWGLPHIWTVIGP